MTTSRQPHGAEPAPGPAGGRSSGRDGDGAGGGRRIVLVVVVVVVVALVAAAGWFLTRGPLSESAQQEREVGRTLEGLSSATSFAEFNGFLCEEQRVPQDLVDTITDSGEQTGTDLDALLRESIAGSLPEDLQVTEVSVDGDDATATVESGSQDAEPEQVRMRNEGGEWKLCEPGVGMGSVPDSGQPG